MAAVATESWLSRQYVKGRRGKRLYIVTGTDDEDAAATAVEAVAPATWHGLARQPVEIEPVQIDDGNDGFCVFNAIVNYSNRTGSTLTPPVTGDSEYSFETGGATEHITQAKETIEEYPTGTDGALPMFGTIGVTDDGVEGCDIVVPQFTFAETHYKDDGDVDSAYKAVLASLTGKVNDDTFRGFAAGEVLFLGASGQKTGDDQWAITFRFAVSLNKTGLAVGLLTGIAKKGWEYMWVRYQALMGTTGSNTGVIKAPVAAYVVRVYDNGDFDGLEI